MFTGTKTPNSATSLVRCMILVHVEVADATLSTIRAAGLDPVAIAAMAVDREAARIRARGHA